MSSSLLDSLKKDGFIEEAEIEKLSDFKTSLKNLKVVLFTSKCERGLQYQDSLAIPLGLQILKTYFEKYGAHCDVCDLEMVSEDSYIKRIEKGYYDFIGFSPTHWNAPIDVEFIFELRRANKKSPKPGLFIAGGHTATIEHKWWLECGIDLILLGHCELSFLKVAECFVKNNKKLSCDIYSDIQGVAYFDSTGKLIVNHQPQQPPEDFTYSMYNMMKEMKAPYHEYWDRMRSRASDILNANNRSFVVENARLYTSNRCLAKCGFCSCVGFLPTAHQVKSAKFIGLTAPQIHDLILHKVNNYGARAFSFNDEDFLVGNNVGISRAIELCEMVIKSKEKGLIPKEVKFSCQTRAGNFLMKVDGGVHGSKKILNHKLLKAMAASGFHNVSMGIESFSDRLLQAPSINKAGMTVEDCEQVLQGFFKYKLFPTINLILLIPETKPEDLIQTLYTAMNYIDKPIQLSSYPVMRMFPGAPIWNSKNYPTDDVNIKNDLTGEDIRIPVFCIPQDDTLRQLYKVIYKIEADEIQSFKDEYEMNDNFTVPRVILSLCLFRAVTKFLNEEKLLKMINDKIANIASENGLVSSPKTSSIERKHIKSQSPVAVGSLS